MTAGDRYRYRCRWHGDGGRCPGIQAFPGVREVPELCSAHLTALEPWIATRAALRSAQPQQWVDWMRRKAEDMQEFPWLYGGRGRHHGNTGGTP